MSTSDSTLTRSDGAAISVIAWASLIGGLSTLLYVSERLQKDTEGLV